MSMAMGRMADIKSMVHHFAGMPHAPWSYKYHRIIRENQALAEMQTGVL